MKKAIIVSIILSFLSCENDSLDLPIIAACDVNNPIEELTWLKNQISEIENNEGEISKYFFIEIADYNNQTVFIANNCCPICNTVVPIFDCEGQSLGLLGSDILSNELSNTRIIFKREDFSCQID